MKMRTKKEKLKFLHDMVKFYHSGNRGMKDSGCVYSPTKNSPGCSIGRKIRSKKLCKKLDEIPIDSAVQYDSIFNLLPENLRSYGKKFLIEIQSLHDESKFWDKNGFKKEFEDFILSIEQKIKEGII